MKKTIRRTMSLALALALIAGIAVPSASFSTEVSAMEYQPDEHYTSSKRAEWINDVKWSFDNKSSTLTISGKGLVGYRNSVANFPWASIAEKVKKVVVKKGITEIGYACFSGFKNMEYISLPEGLVRIDTNAFVSCHKLKSIHLPASLSVLEANLHAHTSLEKITVDNNNKYFKAIDNVLFSKDMKKLITYPMTKKNETYTIPEGVVQIGIDNTHSGGFGYNTYIKKVVMPKSMRIIYHCSFMRCRNLKTVVLNEGLEKIAERVFEGNYALESIVIPSTVKAIHNDVFLWCRNLKTVKILSKNCVIRESRYTLPSDANIYCYAGSTTQKYLSEMGGIFVDIKTGKRINYNSTNTRLISQMPVNITAEEPHSSNIANGFTSTGKVFGYQTNVYHETNKNCKNYQELLSKTKSIIKNCKTDYEKAVALTRWVNLNIGYKYARLPGNTIDSVYSVYKSKAANCMGKSLLLEYMLYMAGIPNAHITSADHAWSAALVNGKWLILDPTNYQVGYNADKFDRIGKITFTVSTCTFDIHNNCGIYLSGLTYRYADTDKMKSVYIPIPVKNVYPNVQQVLNKMVILDTRYKKLKVNDTLKFKVSGRTTNLKWHTTDSKVAVIKDGKVTAVGKGMADIFVYNDLKKSCSCRIIVE